jgi:hypothetical protein
MYIIYIFGVEGYGHFQQYLKNNVAVSFIGGGNRSNWRKPLTCRKSDKLDHIMFVEYTMYLCFGARV